MRKHAQLQRDIASALESAAHPAVLCSFGNDSLVVAAVATQVRPDVTLLFFPAERGDTAAMRELTRRRGWRVLTYPPANAYPLQDATGGFHWVQENDFNGSPAPFFRDLEPDAEGFCTRFAAHPALPLPKHEWDVILTGQRDDDIHPLWTLPAALPDGTPLGDARLFAPLRAWSAAEVQQGLRLVGLTPADVCQDDTVRACVECWRNPSEHFCARRQETLPPVESFAARTAKFRECYGLNV